MRGARIFGGFVVLGLGISAVDERPSRIIRAIYVSSQVAIDYKINGKSSQVHTRTGQRILELCLALGGPFIKAGQFLAAMNHTVPKEITDILAKLQDNTSPKSLEYVERVIREDLGDHVFEKIEEAPVGSASLAQVHKAWIKGTGDVVAVKVQYPNLREIVEADLSTMAMISFVAAKTFLKADFTWIFQEFKESLLSELDFVQEAKRAQRVAVNLKEDSCFYVPKVYPQYTSKRVLTMEFVQGCKVSEVEKIESMGMDPKRVARKVIEMFSRMIYINGFFHCDPHPGNILVRKNLDRSNKREKFQIVLLDHGLYRDLSEEFRTNYCLLWKSLLFQNEKMLKESSENLGVGRFYKLFPLIFTFRHAKSSRSALIDAKMPEKEREQIVNDFKDSTVEDFNQFLQSVPRDMLLIFRTNALVRSLNFALGGSTASRLGVMFEFAMRGSYICHNDEMKASEKLSLFRKSKLWFDLLRLKMSLWIISLIEMSFKRSHNIQSKLVG